MHVGLYGYEIWSLTKRREQIKGIWGQGAENIWNEEGRNNRKLEKTAK
jgi:hypothetical protein